MARDNRNDDTRDVGSTGGGGWWQDERPGWFRDDMRRDPYRRPPNDPNYNPGTSWWSAGAPYGPYPSLDGRHENWRERDGERGMWDRASDEVASWFGDEAAEARREADHRGRGPKGYQRSDARILEDVNDKLTADAVVDASDVTVSVQECEVTLNGEVTTRRQKRRAEDCAEDVSGVRHVQNNLRIRQAFSEGTPS